MFSRHPPPSTLSASRFGQRTPPCTSLSWGKTTNTLREHHFKEQIIP